MVSIDEAISIILTHTPVLGLEKVDLLGSSRRVLAEDILARYSIPHCDISTMDGFALREKDIKDANPENPVTLHVIETLKAGAKPKKEIGSDESTRIMTGAILPAGADTVVRFEDTHSQGTKKVEILNNPGKGANIKRAGEKIETGSLLSLKGKVSNPFIIGLIASQHRSFVHTYQKPRVAVLATGDELVDIDGEGGDIVCSNLYSVGAHVLSCGGIPLLMGIAKDNRKDLERKIMQGLSQDMLITTGGVSKGDYDMVEDVLTQMGFDLKFSNVMMYPGKSLIFGTMNSKPVFGLPGNPSSSMISFELLVHPAIKKMQGHSRLFLPKVKACLTENIVKKAGFANIKEAFLEREEIFKVTPKSDKYSNVLINSLIVIPENVTGLKKGETVEVQLLESYD